jgi:hypothetical protein
VNNGTSVGAACVDVSTNTSCGYTELGVAANSNASSEAQISGGTSIGTRYYLVGGDKAQV